MVSLSSIEVGQRFRQTGANTTVWTVIDTTDDHAGNPHARMMDEADPTRVVTIAFAALSDGRLYRRLGPEGCGPIEKGP